MEVSECWVILNVPAVLAKVEFDVVPLRFGGFLKYVAAAFATLNCTSEFGVRERSFASAADVADCGLDAANAGFFAN